MGKEPGKNLIGGKNFICQARIGSALFRIEAYKDKCIMQYAGQRDGRRENKCEVVTSNYVRLHI